MPQEWDGWLPGPVGDRLFRDELAAQRAADRSYTLRRLRLWALAATALGLVAAAVWALG